MQPPLPAQYKSQPIAAAQLYNGVQHPVLSAVLVVLVAPRVPSNIGAVMRAAANFEAGGVTVVAPRCAPDHADVVRVACESPLLGALRVVPTLREALADTHCSVGFTRRAGGGRVTHPSVHDLLRHVPLLEASIAACSPPSGEGSTGGQPPPLTALVFGREESGLLDSELALCAHACAIPTGRPVPSMNLSHAVAVALAPLFERGLQLLGGADALEDGRVKWMRERRETPASHQELDALLRRAARLLERAGMSAEDSSGGGDKGAHGRRRKPAGHLRALLLRSEASVAEVRALHGLLKEIEAR